MINEVLTYGVLTLTSLNPVNGANMNDVVLKYPGNTFAITTNPKKIVEYKRKATINFDKTLLIDGGYNN